MICVAKKQNKPKNSGREVRIRLGHIQRTMGCLIFKVVDFGCLFRTTCMKKLLSRVETLKVDQ